MISREVKDILENPLIICLVIMIGFIYLARVVDLKSVPKKILFMFVPNILTLVANYSMFQFMKEFWTYSDSCSCKAYYYNATDYSSIVVSNCEHLSYSETLNIYVGGVILGMLFLNIILIWIINKTQKEKSNIDI